MRFTIMTRPVPAVTTSLSENRCPRCSGDFESCRCGIRPFTALADRTVRATSPAEIQREEDANGSDDGLGYERDETDNRLRPVASSLGTPLPQREPGKTLTPDDDFHQLVRHMVADGDQRAVLAGRRTRRTLAQMSPGYTRQPILRLTRPLTFRGADACVLCGRWNCKGDCYAPAPAGASCAGTESF